MRLIEGQYLNDILAQPLALRQTLAALDRSGPFVESVRDMAAAVPTRAVLTGMGSSLYALYPLHLTLVNHGWTSLLIETSELIHYSPGILDQSGLAVAVSQSGQSVEVVRFLDLVRRRTPVIGVTNNPDSRLARESDAVLLLSAGPEASVSCKTYVASLIVLEWLGTVLTGGDITGIRSLLDLASPCVEAYLRGWRRHVTELCTELSGVEQLFVTGRGPSMSAALTGGLILKESARFPAEGMSCAAFRHGPMETVAPHVFVLVFAGDERSRQLNRRLVEAVGKAGGRSALVGDESNVAAFRIPQLADPIRPVVEILPVQMISLALAALRGREAGRFERASKVTVEE
jgi:glucosamine--fructose-6-phosphate aminotransferase (isomerizing)